MRKHIMLCIAVALTLTACNESTYIEHYQIEQPTIESFSPTEGEPGTQVTIIGQNLQRVDSVWIGNTPVNIRYRINNTSLVIEIGKTTESGVISLKNPSGMATSATGFTVNYLAPTITAYPVEGTVNDDVIIEGDNLHFIEYVLIGQDTAQIVSQRKNELVFRVPYAESETPVSLRFGYYDGNETVQVGPAGNTFTILKEAPLISACPTQLTKYTPIVISGQRLNLIDSIFVGSERVLIKSRGDEEISIDMPTNYFGGNMTGDLVGYYYGVRTILICSNMQIIADPNEPRYYTYKNVLLSGRANYGGTEEAFFDGETGIVYSSCDAADNRHEIDFYLYDQAGYVQLYGPHNGSSTLKNFKCDGKTIDSQDGTWNDFYGDGGIATNFKILNPDSANHKAVIDAYEAGTIVSLDNALFEGIAEPASKAPRVYKSLSDPGFTAGSHFCVEKYNYGWVRNYTTGKNGIIKMIDIPKEAVNGRIPELVFDIIWEK